MSEIRLALAQYRPAHTAEQLPNFTAYASKQREWVQRACADGARILVFPEYASLELTALQPADVRVNLSASLLGLQAHCSDFLKLFQTLAREFCCVILAPSFPVRTDGGFKNRVFVCSSIHTGYQDKLMMTRFEREAWKITPGDTRAVFEFEGLKFAVPICYDVEFPLIVRPFVEAGAELLIVPSCTDTLAGYWRVRTGSLARALENQVFVAQSPLVGDVRYTETIDQNIGHAGVYSPMDTGCPDDGLVAIGEPGADWLLHNVDLEITRRLRHNGQVLTHQHWKEQLRSSLQCAALTKL